MLPFLVRYVATSVAASVAVSETHRIINNRRAGMLPPEDGYKPLEPIPLDAQGRAIPLEHRRIFGVPGAALLSADLDDSSVQAGLEGELRVADELERLAGLYPNMYVFHSVKLPGKVGDVDHVVVQGNTMLLVDSKNWKHGSTYHVHYSTREADYVSRDGASFEGGEIHTQAQTRDWGAFFANSGLNVRALLVVANRTSAVSASVGAPYWFTNLGGMDAAFAGTFSTEPVPPMQPPLLAYILSLVQSRMPAVQDQLTATLPTPRPKVTTLTKWLVAWSCLNYAIIWILLPLAPLSAAPLLTVAHIHRGKLKRAGLPGQGLLMTVLVFTYLLVALWAIFLLQIGGLLFSTPAQAG